MIMMQMAVMTDGILPGKNPPRQISIPEITSSCAPFLFVLFQTFSSLNVQGVLIPMKKFCFKDAE